jgi:hypothetical protein
VKFGESPKFRRKYKKKSVNGGLKLSLTYSSDLKMDDVVTFETDFLRTTRGYKPEAFYTYFRNY